MEKHVGPRGFEPATLPLAGISAECLDTLLQANARAAQLWLNTWMRMAAEIGTFATKRWSHDAELIGRLCGCRSAVDVVELQAAFAERTMKDYMRETVKLADMEMDAATEEMAEMGKGAREATKIVAANRKKTIRSTRRKV
jgi:hypothetical protein